MSTTSTRPPAYPKQGHRTAWQRDLRDLPWLPVRHELADIEHEFHNTGTVAPCKRCGGIIKSATISFGQQMPAAPMQRAHDETMQCDLFIVLGSSLSVFPAADFPLRARQNGAALVIVNRDPTQMDDVADVVIHAGIGETMKR